MSSIIHGPLLYGMIALNISLHRPFPPRVFSLRAAYRRVFKINFRNLFNIILYHMQYPILCRFGRKAAAFPGEPGASPAPLPAKTVSLLNHAKSTMESLCVCKEENLFIFTYF
jgi:hypothetical protein